MHDSDKDPLKFLIYSAHDTQVVNMMTFLQKDFYWTPYASNVIFELKYSASCMTDGAKDHTCFSVGVAFNGNPQLFDGCTGDNYTLEGCKYDEFVKYVNDRWYTGPGAPDLDAACSADV